MASADDLKDETKKIFSTTFEERNGTVVPSTESVALKDGSVKVEATFLYADLAGSTTLARLCPWKTTAKIIRAYLACSTRIIRSYGGEIRSFDGDRVMGVFMGDTKNSDATKCAREIFWFVEKVLNPQAKERFTSVREKNIKIKNGIGIDTGDAYAVRAGIRGSDDLIWIGRPPSIAAKLSDIRDYPYSIYITKKVFNRLMDNAKFVDDKLIWEEITDKIANQEEVLYRTNYLKSP